MFNYIVGKKIAGFAIGKGLSFIKDKIEEAEKTDKDGLTKKDMVLSQVKQIVNPVAVKISDELSEFLVESVFQLLKNKTSVN
jgi:hypothetical protein